jgi:hypothetical protein
MLEKKAESIAVLFAHHEPFPFICNRLFAKSLVMQANRLSKPYFVFSSAAEPPPVAGKPMNSLNES